MEHPLAGELGNSRNGYGARTVLTDTGRIGLAFPRDRRGRFAPQLIARSQRRLSGIDETILPMSARGISTREVTAHRRDP